MALALLHGPATMRTNHTAAWQLADVLPTQTSIHHAAKCINCQLDRLNLSVLHT